MGRRQIFYIIKITVPKENRAVVDLYDQRSINIEIYRANTRGNMRQIDKPQCW